MLIGQLGRDTVYQKYGRNADHARFITWSCCGISGRIHSDEMSRAHCKSSAAGPENFADLQNRPLRRNIMFQPSYNVNKRFNRSVSWLGCWNRPYSLLWSNLRELAGTFALQIMENIHNFRPGKINYDFYFGFVHLHRNEKDPSYHDSKTQTCLKPLLYQLYIIPNPTFTLL